MMQSARVAAATAENPRTVTLVLEASMEAAAGQFSV